MNIGDVSGLTKVIATIAILVAVTLLIMTQVLGQVEDQAGSLSAAANATQAGIDAIATIPGWLAIIVIVVIGAIIMRLMGFF